MTLSADFIQQHLHLERFRFFRDEEWVGILQIERGWVRSKYDTKIFAKVEQPFG